MAKVRLGNWNPIQTFQAYLSFYLGCLKLCMNRVNQEETQAT